MLNGSPLTPQSETINGSGTSRMIGLVEGDGGYLRPGEYQVLVALDGQPVFADIVVVD